MIFYSHEGKSLSHHLAEVAGEMVWLLQEIPLPGKEAFLKAALLTGFGHDFGKFTRYFQRYLLEKVKEENRHHHAFISGIWSAYLISKGFSLEKRAGLDEYLPLLAFFAVVRHHGNLDFPGRHLAPPRYLRDPEFEDLFGFAPDLARKLLIVQEQIEDLAGQDGVDTALEEALQKCSVPVDFLRSFPHEAGEVISDLYTRFLKSWRSFYERLFRLHYSFQREKDEIKKTCYFACLALFSSLIDADKRDAGDVQKIPRSCILPEIVEKYRALHFKPSHRNALQGTGKDKVLRLRERLYRNVCTKMKQVPLDQHLFTITAPTGSGKTLASLGAAMILRERVKKEKGYYPRIIYSLPFTNIIDQTHEVFRDVFASLPDFQAKESVYLLKHHHLAGTSYHLKQDSPVTHDSDEISVDQALLLIESWESEVIVTTFVQLLSSLIGHRNRMLKKMNKMIGGIIILDEVQNIPVEYWSLVREAFFGLAQYLGAYIILMTATRPLLFTSDEAVELAGNQEEIRDAFSALNRVEVEVDLEPHTLEDVCIEFCKHYDAAKSYLFVANTIRSSIEIYNRLKEALGSRAPFYYLSTNIVPIERGRRIAEISRSLREKRNPLVVSTQVVEAGVDLDFHEVWRDLGPVDAVIQVAGRCNRNFLQHRGLVRAVHLVNEKGDAFAKRIYGAVHYQQAQRLLAEKTRLAESDFYDLIVHFFQAVAGAKRKDEARKILQAMQELVFWGMDEEEASVSSFALIRPFSNYTEVFVEIDEASREIWSDYCRNVWTKTDPRQRRKNFLSLKKDFYAYVISVPRELVLGFYDAQKKIYPAYLPGEFLEDYYDRETGFRRGDRSEEDPLII